MQSISSTMHRPVLLTRCWVTKEVVTQEEIVNHVSKCAREQSTKNNSSSEKKMFIYVIDIYVIDIPYMDSQLHPPRSFTGREEAAVQIRHTL